MLIVAGDMTARDKISEWVSYFSWLKNAEYTKKVFIAGNHDNYLEQCLSTVNCISLGLWENEGFIYLCDSGIQFEDLKIWGSPWSLTFPGINPRCSAFTGTEDNMKRHFDFIPDDIDILITHCAPYGILDQLANGRHVGCHALRKALDRVKPRLHIFGHIHECGGKSVDLTVTRFINASHVDERYNPANAPITFCFEI